MNILFKLTLINNRDGISLYKEKEEKNEIQYFVNDQLKIDNDYVYTISSITKEPDLNRVLITLNDSHTDCDLDYLVQTYIANGWSLYDDAHELSKNNLIILTASKIFAFEAYKYKKELYDKLVSLHDQAINNDELCTYLTQGKESYWFTPAEIKNCYPTTFIRIYN